MGVVSDYISNSDVNEQSWVWPYEGEKLVFERYEWVRVRIETEQWHDLSPVAPAEREAAALMGRRSPYSITVCHDACHAGNLEGHHRDKGRIKLTV